MYTARERMTLKTLSGLILTAGGYKMYADYH